MHRFLTADREGRNVIVVHSLMQPDQITFQAQPAKHQGLPEYNEHSSALDWKPPSLVPEIFIK